MRPFLKLLCVGVLGTGLGLSTADAQSPRGDRRPGGGQPPGADGPRGGGSDRKADVSLDGWVKTLAEKITDPHDAIRDSSRAALISVGPPALPLLRKLADGDDAARAFAAKKLIGAIERPQNAGPGMGRGPMTGALTRVGPDGSRPMGGTIGGGGFGARPTPDRGTDNQRPGADRGQNNPWPNAGRGPNNDRPNAEPRRDRQPNGEPRGGQPNAEPRRDRQPEPNNPPRGERRPESNNPPAGERRPEGDRRPGNAVEETIKSLNLNDKQQKQVGEILQANHKRLADLSEKGRDGQGDRTQLRAVRDGLLKELKEVLNAEQFEKLSNAVRTAMPLGEDRPRDGGERLRGGRESR